MGFSSALIFSPRTPVTHRTPAPADGLSSFTLLSALSLVPWCPGTGDPPQEVWGAETPLEGGEGLFADTPRFYISSHLPPSIFLLPDTLRRMAFRFTVALAKKGKCSCWPSGPHGGPRAQLWFQGHSQHEIQPSFSA